MLPLAPHPRFGVNILRLVGVEPAPDRAPPAYWTRVRIALTDVQLMRLPSHCCSIPAALARVELAKIPILSRTRLPFASQEQGLTAAHE